MKVHWMYKHGWYAACGRWLNYSGLASQNWDDVDCKRCLKKRKVK